MTLYLYDKSSGRLVREIQNVLSYTDQSVTTAAAEYGPLAEGLELSATADCAGTLRADYRRDYPTTESRLEDLEALVAELLFGGEAE